MGLLTGKTALVTGAARGIGKAIALKFAEEGANVAFTDLVIDENGKATENEIAAKGVKAKGYASNAADFSQTEEVVNQVKADFGSIDILVNNAGISYIGLFTDMKPEDWSRVINTNLTSVFNCCSLAVPDMVKNKSGKIINISSVWGNSGASCEVAYSASKGGMNAFTKALAKELAPSNVQVNAVACGAIDTEMNQWLEDAELMALIEEIPANRLGRAEEVADLVYHLANKNEYLTGQIIGLDGGWI